MKVGRLRSGLIVVRSAYATLRITVATLYDVYRGSYRRELVDGRLHWWAQRLLDLVALRCTVVNPAAITLAPGRPTVIMCNHASLYDIPLIFVALPGSIRMLTKTELFRVPIWGRGTACSGRRPPPSAGHR